MAGEALAAAMANRSLRTVRAEVEFLSELSVLTPQQTSLILAQLPAEDGSREQPSPPAASQPVAQPPPQPAPVPAAQPAPAYQQPVVPPPAPYTPPTDELANSTLNEKAPQQYPSQPAPPPPYAGSPPVLCTASALYAYRSIEKGDVQFEPYDRIHVLQYLNDDWWRGRNERTGEEGIFPRAYVNVAKETDYGNMPVQVSQSGSGPPPPPGAAPPPGPDGKTPNKFEQGGKKFGKKMGNAAIFGAGATMGSNIVNSIF